MSGAPGPNLVDRLVGWLDPERGVKRLQARRKLARMSLGTGRGGAYTAASRERGGIAAWIGSLASPNADVLPDLETLRARSRDADRNIPLLRGLNDTKLRDVLGSGPHFTSQVDGELLGLTEEETKQARKRIERAWWFWAMSIWCDFTRTLRLAALERQLLRSEWVSGDVFLLRRLQPPGFAPLRTCLQVIEADRVSNPGDVVDGSTMPGGNVVFGGIEVTSEGIPVAIHLASRHRDDWVAAPRTWTRIEIRDARTGRARLIHRFDQERPGQLRGVPRVACSLEHAKVMSRATEAELFAAAATALVSILIKTNRGEEVDLETALGTSGGRTEPELGYGTLVELKPGQEVAGSTPSRPNMNLPAFLDAVAREVAVGSESNFEMMVKSFQSNYTAHRAAQLDHWRSIQRIFAGFCDDVMSQVVEWLVEEMVATGYLVAPGFEDDPWVRAAWCAHQFQGQPMPMIDPVKDMIAAKAKEALGIESLEGLIAQHGGGNFEETQKRRAYERSVLEALGLPFPEAAPKPTGQGLGQPMPTAPGPRPGQVEDEGDDPDEDRGTEDA